MRSGADPQAGSQPGALTEFGSRLRKLPAPPPIVWHSLSEPDASGSRPWLDLLDDEIPPTVLSGAAPETLVWSSLWPSRPHDEVHFRIESDGGGGSRVHWRLLTPDAPPDQSKTGHLRFRMNVLISEKLQRSYGQ